ncbi:protein DEFECTIVE IN MERISTEM SILENCING 3-like isoform X2 [Corylus avellana]|uniref:protein DEFECTIVE IN MERISTEM SILENCING 3-like isoform X2 n=1 Tax=Corylus avellana TaxID=13451 RepID=UPI00286D5699|nr:protein DEFECTIVE IN MERISTEM SILENCING 3-like isoform X2 [Corylus avellana]
MHQPNRQDNSESLEKKDKQHEDNLKFLKTQINQLDESIRDLQVSLGRYHCSANVAETANDNSSHTEEETMGQILQQENSAAGVFCWLKANHLSQALDLPLTKDVLGVVANLARVDDDNLSRLLSEYLGLETMLAIVSKTFEGVKALEKYDGEGIVNSRTGLHLLGSSIGKRINGRFLVICLEDLRPYAGGFVADDQQRKLDLPKPKLQNGECPPGFLDYAVNMINLDRRNLSCLTASGHGLRETLFYGLFSRLQIYRTRSEMLLALTCITDGALSLDGGMIKKPGVFDLGSRKDVEVKFPVASGKSNAPVTYIQTEDMIKKLEWERSKFVEDMQREQQLLDHANFTRHA